MPERVALLRKVARSHNLTDEEYRRIVKTLGRQPTVTEVGIFGVMHSEHCAYGSSKVYLKTFPTQGPRVLVPAGKENAGAVDIGNGFAIVHKCESHNHPSAVEPVEGAATGVGGILRDIFTMGARPIALFDSLRFGELRDAQARFHLEGVVRGIAKYGNCCVGAERLLIRNRGTFHDVSIGRYLEHQLEGVRGDAAIKPRKAFEVLSFDRKRRTACWRPVTRVFRYRVDATLRIQTAMGRTFEVTPDHPMWICSGGELIVKPARALGQGDRVPLLDSSMPAARGPTCLDLVAFAQRHTDHLYVQFRRWPQKSAHKTLRRELRRLPLSTVRYAYLRKGYLPIRIFLALERRLGLPRSSYRLFEAATKRSTLLPTDFPLNGDVARLVGYWIADGSVYRSNGTWKLRWHMARKDTGYIRDIRGVLRKLGIQHTVTMVKPHAVAITVSSRLLGVLFREVLGTDSHAHEKRIPDVFLAQPWAIKGELLKGLFRGDGSLVRQRDGRLRLTFATVSETLRHQVLLLLQESGVCASVIKKSNARGYNLGTRRTIFEIRIGDQASIGRLGPFLFPAHEGRVRRWIGQPRQMGFRRPPWKRHGGHCCVPIRRIRHIHRQQDVYDLEVGGTHSFVTTAGLITHNCVGVPTVGGEIAFDRTYRENPLVNVMCIGLVRAKSIARGQAKGVGNPVLYVGSSTGRDGLGGASFASRELSSASEADRPAVQIGDPFAEKCLIEATLEALATGDVVGLQDMGAAGLTCSTCETASRGGTGIEIDVAKVPRRAEGMTPYEVMLSESQERMLLIVRKGREARIKQLFARWGLSAVEIGRVTKGNRMVVRDGEQVVADIPVRALTDDVPVYHRPKRRPGYLSAARRLDVRRLPLPKDYAQTLLTLLASPTIASKAPVFEQYDHMVQTNTAVLPGRADAAVLRLKETGGFLAASIGANGRYCYLDPYEGGKQAVAEVARNLVCVGARPLAVTDCLNFGSPKDPQIMWQFAECVRGIGDACRAFGTPVTGGNVSFYNESPSGAVDPTPVVGMIGLIEMGRGAGGKRQGKPTYSGPRCLTASFKDEGDVIVLLGETREELGGSEYLAVVHRRKAGLPPRVDLKAERALQRLMLELAARGWLKSAHDCSEGGLAVALAESCVMDPERGIGATVQLDGRVGGGAMRAAIRPDALLFGETQGRVVISCARQHVELLEMLAQRRGVPCAVIGTAGGRRLELRPWIDEAIDVVSDTWRCGLTSREPRAASAGS